jgi:hypothetical protein
MMIIRIITNLILVNICETLVFATNNYMKDQKIRITVVENEVAKK